MTSWLLLTDVERRRVSRVAVRLARANPLLVPAAIGVVVGVMWLAIKAGAGAAIMAVFLSSGLSAVLAIILMGGVLLGLGLAAAAPRFEGLDAQIRTVPIAPLQAYLGTTAIPLTVAWFIFAIPVFDFGTSLFRTVQVPAPNAWAGLLLLAQLIACVTGAAILEVLRARPSRRALLAAIPLVLAFGLPAVAASLTSAPTWSWLAAALPPLAAILLLQFAAGAPLALSSDLAQGRWLWRSIPPTGREVGLSWWIVIGTITAAISLVVVAPVFAVMSLDAYPFVLGALVMAAPIPAAVGRLLPFRHDALARQLGVLALQLVFFLGPLGIAALIAQRFLLEAAPVVVLVGVLALTGVICSTAPWREA